MAETAAAPAKAGLFKWLLGAAGGIISGVLLMYVTGFVNTVVKPPKPVPNFQVDVDGLTARLTNRTPDHHEGWWDFGDGSALEPVTAERPVVEHPYARMGTYTVKMTLHNLLGEVGERAVPITLSAPSADATASAKEAPHILELTTTALNEFAPATFQVTGKVEHAQMCVWSLDGKMRRTADGVQAIERLVTIDRPGAHTISLAAFDGTHDEPQEERRVVVNVKPPPDGSIVAILNVTGSATHLDTLPQERTLYGTFPAGKKENTVEFSVAELAVPGCTIAEAQVKTPDGKGPRVGGDKKEIALEAPTVKGGSVRDLRLVVDEKNFSVRLTGKLTRSDAAARGQEPLPVVAVPVLLTQQRRVHMNLQPQTITSPLTVPAGGKPTFARLKLPPLPSDWLDAQRKVSLELKDGERSLAQWPDLQKPARNLITVHNHACNVTVTPTKDAVEVSLQAN
jgi:hypothetical protein